MVDRWCFKCESCGQIFSMSNEVMTVFYNRLREDPQQQLAASMVFNNIVSCCRLTALITLLKPTVVTADQINKYFDQRIEESLKGGQ